jgi:hypothetical protein
MPEPVVPAPITYVEPSGKPVAEQATTGAAATTVTGPMRAAALRVLARDGRDIHLQQWQVAYLIATAEGREGVVPLGCGVGKGWLQARLDEELAGD